MSYYADDLLTLELGDCVEVMRELPAESVDAVVTDPPYLIGFMGKGWDRVDGKRGMRPEVRDAQLASGAGWTKKPYAASAKPAAMAAGEAHAMQKAHEAWAREAFRVAKPGAHLLAFGGTRTYHRLASAIEDAGWEIRDCLVWGYASGFPKSLDVSKAIDKAAGAEREVERSYPRKGRSAGIMGQETEIIRDITAPATPDAAKWDGWGTALKPAWEPIVLARKPLRGTVAANVLEHGTGALNIGATRIPGAWSTWRRSDGSIHPVAGFGDEYVGGTERPSDVRQEEHPAGRWPANLLLTDPIFDGGVPGVVGGGETGIAPKVPWTADHASRAAFPLTQDEPAFYGDSGTYSRFFLVPKSSRSDREPLLRGTLDERPAGALNMRTDSHSIRNGMNTKARENLHPTVKPLELMRHLVRLVTPPGGTVLDCFAGSGSTLIAANAEGFRAIGIEREQEYLDIAVARLAHQEIGLGLDVAAPVRKRTTPSDAKMPKPRFRESGTPKGWNGGWVDEADEVPA